MLILCRQLRHRADRQEPRIIDQVRNPLTPAARRKKRKKRLESGRNICYNDVLKKGNQKESKYMKLGIVG